MLECLVFGRRCARSINASHRASPTGIPPIEAPTAPLSLSQEEIRQDRLKLRKALSHAFGPVRRMDEMQYGLQKLQALADKYDQVLCKDSAALEPCNMTVVALEIAKAAVARKESVGAHYIEE
jgi:aspartate oxidase